MDGKGKGLLAEEMGYFGHFGEGGSVRKGSRRYFTAERGKVSGKASRSLDHRKHTRRANRERIMRRSKKNPSRSRVQS